MTHHVAKIIEIIGSSQNGWEEAAQVAIEAARKTIHNIHGLEMTDMIVKVEQRADVKISFAVEHESR